mmetsp:Transcript_83975/g.246250  ORF Transcript_83975/g.246250 Transcript_83975/m.246250 type:complete len:221 (-) Transcript_83975:66-728(-)
MPAVSSSVDSGWNCRARITAGAFCSPGTTCTSFSRLMLISRAGRAPSLLFATSGRLEATSSGASSSLSEAPAASPAAAAAQSGVAPWSFTNLSRCRFMYSTPEIVSPSFCLTFRNCLAFVSSFMPASSASSHAALGLAGASSSASSSSSSASPSSAFLRFFFFCGGSEAGGASSSSAPLGAFPAVTSGRVPKTMASSSAVVASTSSSGHSSPPTGSCSSQ